MSDGDLLEIFAALGPVTVRRMFSGKGVYVDGVIVAIEYEDELRFKADVVSAPDFADAGATQWTYHGHRGAVLMPYWSIPDEALDDPDVMDLWARRAIDAGLRANVGKASRAKRKPRLR